MNYITKSIKYFDPIKIANSGQAFRFNVIDATHVEVVASGKYLQIAYLGNNQFAFNCNEEDFNCIWYDYFDLNRDYDQVINTIDPSDLYLTDAAKFGYGIRILHQDIFEMVISFIISQRRSIPSIMTCVERICEKYGNKIIVDPLDDPFVKPSKSFYYSFPTFEEMSVATSEEISNMGAGYRAPYIMSAINDFNTGKITPDLLNKVDSDILFSILTGMHGIGPKVANCIMLFALQRIERFPIDVWMQRIIDKYYNGEFDYSVYPEAGIIQQFMFYYERIDSEHK